MIKLKFLIKEISEDEYKQWRSSKEYKKWRKDWLTRHNAKFDGLGRVIAYHGTSPNKAKSIKQNGFNTRSYFSLNPEYSKKWGRFVFNVYLPLDAIDFVASDIVAIRPIKFDEVI